MVKHLALIVTLWAAATPAFGWGLALRFGPPALGRGGANPVGIPPSMIDTQLVVAGNGGFETNISVTGILFGQRVLRSAWGGFVTLGGGLVISGNGVGPGAYTGFGMDWGCGTFCFSAEYLRALGVGPLGVIQPYAIRIGAALWFK